MKRVALVALVLLAGCAGTQPPSTGPPAALDWAAFAGCLGPQAVGCVFESFRITGEELADPEDAIDWAELTSCLTPAVLICVKRVWPVPEPVPVP